MWSAEHRKAARRSGLRYDGDMTDEEWALVEPMIPPVVGAVTGAAGGAGSGDGAACRIN